eukprot:5066426-Amphidinium_carterae.1
MRWPDEPALCGIGCAASGTLIHRLLYCPCWARLRAIVLAVDIAHWRRGRLSIPRAQYTKQLRPPPLLAPPRIL